MAFPEDAKRLLRDNLRTAGSKISAGAGFALAWVAPYKAAEYLGVASRLHKWLFVLLFYVVIGVLTIILFLYRSLHEAYQRMGPSFPTQKAFADFSATFIGVVKQEMIDEAFIFGNGSSISTNDVTLHAYADQITRIEHTTSTPNVPSPDGTGTPTKSLEVIAEPRSEDGIKIRPEISRQTASQCVWSINFVPGLRKGKSTSYRYRVTTLPGSFALTLEEARRRNLDHEHYSHQISYPTSHFRLKVSFSQEIAPASISYDVWIGKGGVRHMDEYIRVAKESYFRTGTDKDNQVYGEVEVPYPIYGLRYLIIWKPNRENGA
jgi:hypothetical protein